MRILLWKLIYRMQVSTIKQTGKSIKLLITLILLNS